MRQYRFSYHRHGLGLLLAALGICSLLTFAVAERTRQQPTGRDAAQSISCLSNLRQLGLGLLMFCQDYDETLPVMKTSAQMQNALFPYVKNRQIFTCPATKRSYVVVPGRSGKKVRSFKLPAQTIVLRDAKAHPDGTWGVAYLNGRAQRVRNLPA